MPKQFAHEFERIVKALVPSAASIHSELQPNGDVCVTVNEVRPRSKPLVIWVKGSVIRKFRKLTMAQQDEATERLYSYLSELYESLPNEIITDYSAKHDFQLEWAVGEEHFLPVTPKAA